MTSRDRTVQPKPGTMTGVHVTDSNLAAVAEWLRHDLGNTCVTNGRIYTGLYSEQPGPIIGPGHWLVRHGHTIQVLTPSVFGRLFQVDADA